MPSFCCLKSRLCYAGFCPVFEEMGTGRGWGLLFSFYFLTAEVGKHGGSTSDINFLLHHMLFVLEACKVVSPIYFCKWEKCQYNPEGEKYLYNPEGATMPVQSRGGKMPVQSRGAGLAWELYWQSLQLWALYRARSIPPSQAEHRSQRTHCCGLISQCIKHIKEGICTSWKVFNTVGVWILAAVPWFLPNF